MLLDSLGPESQVHRPPGPKPRRGKALSRFISSALLFRAQSTYSSVVVFFLACSFFRISHVDRSRLQWIFRHSAVRRATINIAGARASFKDHPARSEHWALEGNVPNADACVQAEPLGSHGETSLINPT